MTNERPKITKSTMGFSPSPDPNPGPGGVHKVSDHHQTKAREEVSMVNLVPIRPGGQRAPCAPGTLSISTTQTFNRWKARLGSHLKQTISTFLAV